MFDDVVVKAIRSVDWVDFYISLYSSAQQLYKHLNHQEWDKVKVLLQKIEQATFALKVVCDKEEA